jgi:7,8-dihydroneopterin aldolase/epimerase/oxygenase
MDHIFIRDLRIDARVGFHKRERYATQTLRLDLEIGIADDAVFASDRVADCIDYDRVVERVRALLGEGHFNLVETIADRIARVLLEEFGAAHARVSVAKLGVMKNAGRVGVTVERRR